MEAAVAAHKGKKGSPLGTTLLTAFPIIFPLGQAPIINNLKVHGHHLQYSIHPP